MSIFGKSFPGLCGFGALVSALLALVNNTLGGRGDMERERGKETEGTEEMQKEMSLPCGGPAGQQPELKMFEVQTNL